MGLLALSARHALAQDNVNDVEAIEELFTDLTCLYAFVYEAVRSGHHAQRLGNADRSTIQKSTQFGLGSERHGLQIRQHERAPRQPVDRAEAGRRLEVFKPDVGLEAVRVQHNQSTCPARTQGMNPRAERPGVNAVVG
jgi:hypothetical protein